jgi:hypothetical protein
LAVLLEHTACSRLEWCDLLAAAAGTAERSAVAIAAATTRADEIRQFIRLSSTHLSPCDEFN